MARVLFIDYDNTLHDSDAKFTARLDGAYGLTASEVIELFLKVHRGIVHQQYPDRHDDLYLHHRLVCEMLNLPCDEGEAVAMAKKFRQAQEECWTDPIFFPDTFDFLQKAAAKHTLCLTTGDYAPQKAAALERAGGRNFFTFIFDDTQLGLKGTSLYFSNALASTGARPGETVTVGDSLDHDIAAAREVGIATVWVNRRGHPPPPDAVTPDREARNLFEVLEYLEAL
jgi:HAD superfamily hydrolase (TIGR01549 family)